MKITTENCPTCQRPAWGEHCVVEAVARIETKDGNHVYTGYTEILWDTQKVQTPQPKGKVLLICEEGHNWVSDCEGEL